MGERFDTAAMLTSASPSVASTDRVLQVLAVLAQHGRAMSASELMQKTGLARSTLYRQLGRLKDWGFVSETDACYAPGPLSLQLALGFDLASNVMRVARPEMEALSSQSHESVGLIVAVNDRAVCLDMVESPHSLRCSFEKGRSVPLRDGASAKCVLAHLPEVQRRAVLDMHHEPGSAGWREADHTLLAIREAGCATSSGEVDAGVWGASAPVFAAPRHAVGAITLMAPISRVQGQESALTQMTIVAAARISRQLSPP
jgi:DNA-binding IclR family transcriptional regulator